MCYCAHQQSQMSLTLANDGLYDERPSAVNYYMNIRPALVLSTSIATGTTSASSSHTSSTISARLAALESSLPPFSTPYRPNIPLSSPVTRVFADTLSKSTYSAQFKWVPSNYYTLSLDDRASLLSTPSTSQLCKAMLMENVKYVPNKTSKPDSQFYLVVVQYMATIDSKKLESEIRTIAPPTARLPAKNFEFKVAKQTDSDRLTGFEHNSVSPFGLAQDVPIVLATAIETGVNFFWMGAGDVDLKLGMSVDDFKSASGCTVLDVSEPKASA